MTETLCGRYPCKHLCSRVQYCPAGMERVHWLSLHRRASRAYPPNVDLSTGEISEPRHRPSTLSQPERKTSSRLLPTHRAKQSPIPYTRNLKPYTNVAVLSVILLIIGLVVCIGLILTEGNFTPDYEPPKIYHYER